MQSADLLKRKAGAPLSEAERKQRQDAARARWAVAGEAAAATLGAAAGAGAVNAGITRARTKAFTGIKSDLRPVFAERATAAHRSARYKMAVSQIKAKTRGAELLPTAIAALKSKRTKLKNQREWHIDNDVEMPVNIPRDDGSTEVHMVRLSPQDYFWKTPEEESVAAEIEDLETNGRDPRRVKRRGGIAMPRDGVENFQRVRARRRRISWDAGHADQVERALAESQPGSPLHGIGSRQELERLLLIRQHNKILRPALRAKGLKFAIEPEDIRAENVRNVPRVRGDHNARIQGYPDDKGRSALGRRLRESLKERSEKWLAQEAKKRRIFVAAAKSDAYKPALPSIKRLALLRNPKLRAVALAAGALAGGLGAWTVAHKVEQLTKADGDTTDDPSPAPEPTTDVERSIAQRLSSVLRGWKKDAGDLLTTRKGTLSSTMLTGLQHALNPLDASVRGGIEKPIEGTVAEADGPKKVLFTLSARGPGAEDYIASYRESRIQALLAEQQEAIKQILIESAKSGMSPDAMARRIRATIGLTPYQAAQVDSFRAQLDALDPGVLKRQLRDGRYDKTVQAAIDAKKKLTDQQVDKMTDAYHRRYLSYRAMTIARTEGVGAANNGHVAAVEDFLKKFPGFTVVKTWIATEDERTRPDHHGLDGQSVIGLHTPFTAPSGDRIKWPHDQAAAAKQVVNCRCTFSARFVPRNLAADKGTGSVRSLQAA